MKNSWFSLSLLSFFFNQSALAQAEFDPLGKEDHRPKFVRVIIESIEVPLPELVNLMSEPRENGNDTDLRATVGKLVEDGTARLHNCEALIARSGESATTEGNMEYIYPTEYVPSKVPNEMTVNGETTTSDNLLKVATPPTPSAFETRNTGSSFEIQPTLGSNSQIIDLRYAPELVEHIGNEVWSEWKGVNRESSIKMPSFYSSRFNSGVTLLSGQPSLVATTSQMGEDGKPDHQRKLLHFVRCDVLSVGK